MSKSSKKSRLYKKILFFYNALKRGAVGVDGRTKRRGEAGFRVCGIVLS